MKKTTQLKYKKSFKLKKENGTIKHKIIMKNPL